MAAIDPVTDDGLRYRKKTSGIVISTPRAATSMSCFRCGKFKLRTNLVSKRYFGKIQLVCQEKCA